MDQAKKTRQTNFAEKEPIVLVCLALLVFIIHIRYLGSLGIITVLDDEFGYWGNAAYLAGIDWSGVISEIPYYSYGYSLVLVPLFFIFDNSIHMYKAAIFLNGIMLSASFLLCYDIAKKLAKGIDKKIIIGIAFLISMYPAYITYSSIAYSECLLILNIWLLAWCFTDLNATSSNYKFVLIGFLSMYLYMIHQRALGVLLAAIIVIIALKLLYKINLKQVLLVAFPIIVLGVIHVYLKDNIQTHLWLNSSGNMTNDYLAQASKVGQIFSIEGFIALVKASVGHLFYLGAASYLLGYFGLYELLRRFGGAVIVAIGNRKLDIQDYHFSLYAFLLIAVFFSLAINIVFMINPSRIDQIVYGRYIDMIMGPVILLGFIALINNRTDWHKIFVTISGVFIFLAIAVEMITKASRLTNFSNLDAVGLSYMNTPLTVLIPALIAILGGWLAISSFKQNGNRMKLTILALISICFFLTGNNVVRTVVDDQTELEIMEVVDYIEDVSKNMPVYFLWDDQGRSVHRKIADCYQFLLKNTPVKLVNKTELEAINEKAFVLTPYNYKYLSDLYLDYEYCMDNQYTYLFVAKTSGLANS